MTHPSVPSRIVWIMEYSICCGFSKRYEYRSDHGECLPVLISIKIVTVYVISFDIWLSSTTQYNVSLSKEVF